MKRLAITALALLALCSASAASAATFPHTTYRGTWQSATVKGGIIFYVGVNMFKAPNPPPGCRHGTSGARCAYEFQLWSAQYPTWGSAPTRTGVAKVALNSASGSIRDDKFKVIVTFLGYRRTQTGAAVITGTLRNHTVTGTITTHYHGARNLGTTVRYTAHVWK